MNLYNNNHLHSGIKFVTPNQRHKGEDILLLKNRKKVYEEAKEKHPERWAGATRDWEYITQVLLNPEKCKSESGLKTDEQQS